jgi:hypothetical protein
MQKIWICLFACTMAFSVHAQTPQQPLGAPPNVDLSKIPLTDDSVKRLLASLGDLRSTFAGYKGGDAQAFAAYVENNHAKAKAESVIRQHGFKDWGDWYLGFVKMMHTYMAYKMQKAEQLNQAQMNKQMQALQNNPNMTPEQKQMAASMMSMAGAYKQIYANVSAADLKVVAAFAADIEQTLRSKE